MHPWTSLADATLASLLLSLGTLATMLLTADAESFDGPPPWGDDPAVLAMLSGMSL